MLQASVEMVNPAGTGRPALVISARPAPLPPNVSFIVRFPSAVPLPKKYTNFFEPPLEPLEPLELLEPFALATLVAPTSLPGLFRKHPRAGGSIPRAASTIEGARHAT